MLVKDIPPNIRCFISKAMIFTYDKPMKMQCCKKDITIKYVLFRHSLTIQDDPGDLYLLCCLLVGMFCCRSTITWMWFMINDHYLVFVHPLEGQIVSIC